MSLRTIKRHCDDLRSITMAPWTDSQEEQAATMQCIEKMRDDIRDLVSRHNAAVLTVIRSHHPETKRIRPNTLRDPVEHLQADHERIDLPTDSACLEPLLLDDIETKNPSLPAGAAVLHRFATVVGYAAGILLAEAERVHARNQQGDDVQRLPRPREDERSPVVDHA